VVNCDRYRYDAVTDLAGCVLSPPTQYPTAPARQQAGIVNMRIGIFGGTFDPVHYGHLLLAESCREQCRLDQVWFMPSAVAPHKQHRVSTDAKARIEMLELATAGHSAFSVCRYEVDRGGVNYTVETLSHLRKERQHDELFFLLGADSLVDLPNWREPEVIAELATIVIVRRPGSEVSFDRLNTTIAPERLNAMRQHLVEMPLIGLSASEIRQRVAGGRSIRFRTPRAVEAYIETHSLYRTPAT
jgi:nicotinate-nucleotide adenylyltransferase